MNGTINRVFYTLKPLIPRAVQIWIRRRIARYKLRKYAHVWPIDPAAASPPPGWAGWPDGKQFAFVLSHDVDTAKGYRDVLKLAEIEERLGFRSCFNFVPERYGKVSLKLLDELRRRGFDVAIHGLKHDGKLFASKKVFERSAKRINAYLAQWGTRGFTSPSMHHNLDWLSELDIDYSISTFDTDPFEPQPDGVRTIFPFLVPIKSVQCPSVQDFSPFSFPTFHLSSGISPSEFESSPPSSSSRAPYTVRRAPFIIELPYTLPQDSTLFILLREKTIDVWRRKLDWIAKHGGMALLNTHPDYMSFNGRSKRYEYSVRRYTDFLEYVRSRFPGLYYHSSTSEMAELIRKQVCDSFERGAHLFFDKTVPDPPSAVLSN